VIGSTSNEIQRLNMMAAVRITAVIVNKGLVCSFIPCALSLLKLVFGARRWKGNRLNFY
jgi:hypothetical protein